ncbi:MAG TPA: acyl-CoA desaturase [Flavitalea sp.]|nr:acyl-CoA desaturase [Flavitalea sp.]
MRATSVGGSLFYYMDILHEMNTSQNKPVGSASRTKGSVKFVAVGKNAFFSTLRNRVDEYFVQKGISRYGDSKMVIKTFVLLSIYLVPFSIILFADLTPLVNLLLWTVMGIGVAGLGMSVMHDANHGAYSGNKKINWLMAHVLNLIGGSTFNWKLQHNILHHTYTNITHIDEDIASKPALRLSPHTPVNKVHRYQWIHSFFLYGLTTLYWVTVKDFIQWARYQKIGVNTGSRAENRLLLIKLILLKTVYFAALLIIPVTVFHKPIADMLIGFLLMHFIAGLILTIIFQLAHSLEGTSHPMPNDRGIIENEWAIHQMHTTTNFAAKNKWLSWYVGGLNFQVEHHLFPKISHIHYPGIAPIVRNTATEFNIPYLEYQTFGDAFRAHIAFLKKLGQLPDIDEAIG